MKCLVLLLVFVALPALPQEEKKAAPTKKPAATAKPRAKQPPKAHSKPSPEQIRKFNALEKKQGK